MHIQLNPIANAGIIVSFVLFATSPVQNTFFLLLQIIWIFERKKKMYVQNRGATELANQARKK